MQHSMRDFSMNWINGQSYSLLAILAQAETEDFCLVEV